MPTIQLRCEWVVDANQADEADNMIYDACVMQNAHMSVVGCGLWYDVGR